MRYFLLVYHVCFNINDFENPYTCVGILNKWFPNCARRRADTFSEKMPLCALEEGKSLRKIIFFFFSLSSEVLDFTYASLNAENQLRIFQVSIVISDGEELKFSLIFLFFLW